MHEPIPPFVQITDAQEIAAVERGEIEGTVYKDGEIYADLASLLQWREKQASVST